MRLKNLEKNELVFDAFKGLYGRILSNMDNVYTIIAVNNDYNRKFLHESKSSFPKNLRWTTENEDDLYHIEPHILGNDGELLCHEHNDSIDAPFFSPSGDSWVEFSEAKETSFEIDKNYNITDHNEIEFVKKWLNANGYDYIIDFASIEIKGIQDAEFDYRTNYFLEIKAIDMSNKGHTKFDLIMRYMGYKLASIEKDENSGTKIYTATHNYYINRI